MSQVPYKNPISPVQLGGIQSVNRQVTFGTNFSTGSVGGYMEVYTLEDLNYVIPVGQLGPIEYSANTIPVTFLKGAGGLFSNDVITLNSDNISSGRRRIGMLVYVRETDTVYQYDIYNYEQLWADATGSTNCVVISDFGTTVRTNTPEGLTFVSAWTASTIEGISGVTRENARWRVYRPFTGGTGNCITDLYVQKIYPCNTDIWVQPDSSGKVYFGSLSGSSGFTVDLVTDTSYESTRLGLNTNSPQYTFDFYARDKKNRLYFRDNLTSAGLVDIKNIIFSGDSDTNASFSVIGPDASGQQGAHGISIGIRGYTTTSSILNDGVGKTGDSFISAFADTNGLNIINGPGNIGANTEDYIRFYAGQIVNDNVPDIHIQGSGVTRGYVGINTTGVTNQLHVFASSNPLRLEGLQMSANTNFLVADSDGIITYTTSLPGSGFDTVQITGTNQFNSTTSTAINFSGINMTITCGDTNTLVFSAITSEVFSGGSGNCVTDLYVQKIYPCNTDIWMQPESKGKVFFGSVSGASGFTIDLVTETDAESTRLGLNKNNPAYTLDFNSVIRDTRIYWQDDLYSGTFDSWRQFIHSGNSSGFVTTQMVVTDTNASASIGFSVRGRNNVNAVAAETNDIGDASVFSSDRTSNLNIVKRENITQGVNPDSIRFYAGLNVSTSDPQMIIIGRDISGGGRDAKKGYVGIGTKYPTNALNVYASSHPVRFEGLQLSANTRFLVADTDGIVTYTSSLPGSGFDTVQIDGVTKFDSTTSTVINFSGINLTITCGDTNTLVFSAATGGGGSGTGTTQVRKIMLRKVDLGSRHIIASGNLPNNLTNILLKSEMYDVLSGRTQNYYGTVLNYYYTVNDTDRKKILFTAETLTSSFDNTGIYTKFSDMITYLSSNYPYGIMANFYCELTLTLDSQYSAPTQMKLVNPLFNSLNARKYSRNHNYTGTYEFVSNYQNGYYIYQNFNAGWGNYYNTTTSQDITKTIYDIVENEPSFYGPLSAESKLAITQYAWDDTEREVVQNSVFVEHLTNFYSKYKIPVNLYKGYNFSGFKLNNFYANILYDILGGNTTPIYSTASAPNYALYSSAFLHMVDNYRILPTGGKFVVNSVAENTTLNNLSYSEYDVQNWKYINGLQRGYPTAPPKTAMQILPGYNEIYVLLINVETSPGTTNALNFLNTLKNDYFVTNNPSVKETNPAWYGMIQNISIYLQDASSFAANPYGPYIIIQSNDEKMYTLSQNPSFDYGVGAINVDAIYKGYTFRPEIYPLNLSQLILEVPESYFYDGSSLQPSENSANNLFELSSNNIVNKKLRLVVKYLKINKWDMIDVDLKYTIQTNIYDNQIFTLTIYNGAKNTESVEWIINNGITNTKRKQLRPGSTEIYFAFYDVDTNKTSLIPNYKIVIINYGDNEIFKLIRGYDETNTVTP